MYKELTIKNLKIFKEEQKLKIAPITLLYGENSSGKTSLLKTFDIVHNIFSENQVKRGKNVSQKDSPFYRNENIQNISAKNIHYYSNQFNKKDINIKILLDVITNNKNIINTISDLTGRAALLNNTGELEERKLDFYSIKPGEYKTIPLKINLKIKYFKKKEISKVDEIQIQNSEGKNLINFSRINKDYKKIEEFFEKDKVGYLSPAFNKLLSRPNRYSGTYNRGRPVAEEDFFVDDALYADYKVDVKEKDIWKNLYKNYIKIFSKDSEIKLRYEKIKNISEALNHFNNQKLTNKKNFDNIKIDFKTFAYFIAKSYLSNKIPEMFFANNKIKRGYKPRFTSVENIVNNLHNKGVCNEIEKILLKDQLKFNSLTSVNISGIPQDKINCPYCGSKYKIDVNLIPRVGRALQCSKCRHSWYFKTKMKVKFDDEEKLFLKDFLLARRIANSGKLNQILIENKLKKKNSFTRFISSCKSDLTRYNVRFYKKGPNIQHELIHEGFEESSETTSDYLNLLSKYISDGSNGLFYEYKVTEGFSLPAFKEETITNILRSCITEIKKTVNNFVISHPSKTNIDWHVARKTDFPKGVLERIQKSKLKEIKENISRGRTVLAEQDEFNRNSHSSRLNIDPDKISADGRNFHTTIINNPNLRVKLNKTLKSLLGLEIKIVTPKFLKEFLKSKESFNMLRDAQRAGHMYPVGLGRYSRTKFIIIRDLKFKKIFEIHGEEIGKGPSNILPFIAQILSDKPSLTYIIQELENNWHPKYQAALIELIASNMKESQNTWLNHMSKSFILETHSELFILQLKKLIQKGVLKPEDVSINLIKRNKEGNSEIHNIPLNTQGGFEKKWPGGFFTERMDILTS
jgi:predicted Zn finger-like uncharacterized protein